MHIPDGLMDPLVFAIGWGSALLILALAVHKINKGLDERTVPFMAILAGGIFVAQMLNFPIGFGTSGHLIGAALATILLGPFAAMIILTVILIIQAFLFGDGGITALGLNILNMAIIAPLVTWAVLMIFPSRGGKAAIPAAAWASVLVAAFACALQLAVSYSISGGAYGIAGVLSFPSMLGLHAIIGVGEAVITSGVVLYLAKVAPEMIKTKALVKRTVEA